MWQLSGYWMLLFLHYRKAECSMELVNAYIFSAHLTKFSFTLVVLTPAFYVIALCWCPLSLSLSLSLSLLSSNILNVNFFRLQQRWVTNVPFKDSNDVKFTRWKLYINYKPFYILFGVEYLDILGYHRNISCVIQFY